MREFITLILGVLLKIGSVGFVIYAMNLWAHNDINDTNNAIVALLFAIWLWI